MVGNSWPVLLFIFFFGCCLGSFLNVCIYRLPQNQSIVGPRSFCPGCRKSIRAYDNIPLLSYFFLGGKCRDCGEKISWRYPLVEALTGGFALALFFKFGLTLSFFSFFAFIAAMVVINFTKREGMGGGDVKLLAMIGAWLGWKAVLFTLFSASLSGTLIGGAAMVVQKQGRHYAVPFGPFLALSALAYLFFGPQLIDWYLSFGKP